MTATILRADARAIPLPDASVDLIVTSPPYFALRSYTDGGEHYAGQIGAEPTPAEYIASLIDCTREWVRVLKPGGSLFVNLGDKYSGYFNRPDREHKEVPEGSISRQQWIASQRLDPGARYVKSAPDAFGIPYKSLMMLPERYRIAAVDQLGLIARAVIVWSKPNGLPESVTDRVRRSHEDWVHLTKEPRYFSAVDEIREPAVTGNRVMFQSSRPNSPGMPPRGPSDLASVVHTNNPLGKLPGSVWEIATEPLKVPAELGVDHFAAFPTEWPRRLVLGWSPSGICTACGEGRRPVTEVTHTGQRKDRSTSWIVGSAHHRGDVTVDRVKAIGAQTTITGEACACPDTSAPTRPAVVLDPFGGTGTTALVASVLGRHGISVDMSADYCCLARWRTTDPGQRAKAARVPAPPKQFEGQGDLFGEWVS